jgi:SCP1.201-like deaminase/Pretoxin HINT domain
MLNQITEGMQIQQTGQTQAESDQERYGVFSGVVGLLRSVGLPPASEMGGSGSQGGNGGSAMGGADPSGGSAGSAPPAPSAPPGSSPDVGSSLDVGLGGLDALLAPDLNPAAASPSSNPILDFLRAASGAVVQFLQDQAYGLAEQYYSLANLGQNIDQDYQIKQQREQAMMNPNFGMNADINSNLYKPYVSEGTTKGLQTVVQIAAENSAFAGGGFKYATPRQTPSQRNSPPTNSTSSTCFPAGTLVATQDGRRAIESIGPGERVWAYDFSINDWRLCQVTRTFHHHHEGMAASIQIQDEVIEATFGHPFWVVRGEGLEDRPRGEHLVREDETITLEGRWVDAGDLRAGDELVLIDGRIVPVREVVLQSFDEIVYNFAVDQLRCYAVGISGVLVHNQNMEGGNIAPKGAYNPPPASLPANTGKKTAGVLQVEGQSPLPLLSGMNGPSQAIRGQGLPGFNGNQLAHVEGHAAAYMRTNGIKEAVLDINKVPCTAGSGGGCEGLLPKMLPEGATLRVRGPGGYDRTFVGLPD